MDFEWTAMKFPYVNPLAFLYYLLQQHKLIYPDKDSTWFNRLWDSKIEKKHTKGRKFPIAGPCPK